MSNPYFGRLLTAMVTPFNEDGSVNCAAGADLAEWLINNGSDGLVVLGTTGESVTMYLEEKLAFIEAVVKRVNKRVPVVIGAGTNCTAFTIDFIKQIEKFDIDGLLVVGPYYNKPTQEGYYQHFAAVAQSTKLPVIVYNVPGRTGSNILPATVARLADDFSNIVAIKEAGGDVNQVAELYRILPSDFTIYSGDDVLILPFMSVGAKGLISVLANVNGNILQDLMQAYTEGRVQDAAEINKKMVPLAKAMFLESNPIPVKAAVSKVSGIPAGNTRLPLAHISPSTEEKLDKVLKEYNMI